MLAKARPSFTGIYQQSTDDSVINITVIRQTKNPDYYRHKSEQSLVIQGVRVSC